MTKEERQFRLKAFVTCLKCEVSGKCCDDNCPTKYEAGNMGEIIENLEAISKTLEQEPKTEWIPVSERLPQKSEYGDVLVTYIPSAGTLWTTVMIAQYSDLMGIAKPSFHIGEVGKKSFQNITTQVTAWMPLPKPYKPQESEDKE